MDNIILTLVRIIVPLLILRWVLVGIIISLQIDLLDWYWYIFHTKDDYYWYQIWDKLLDLYFIGIAFYISLVWKDVKARTISSILFFYRFLGVILFFITSNSWFLFLFPNVFEVFFIFYIIYRKIAKTDKLFFPKEKGIVFLIILAVPKIIQEYIVHVVKSTPKEILRLGNFIPNSIDWSFWLVVVVFLLIYVFILFWRIKINAKLPTS